MDELMIMAFVRMVYEKPLNLKRLPNGYCGDGPHNECTICKDRPWWEIDFVNVGPIVIGWRKRVIVIDWSKTGSSLVGGITSDDTTRDDTMIHAWGYGKAIEYLITILSLLRMQKREEGRIEATTGVKQ